MTPEERAVACWREAHGYSDARYDEDFEHYAQKAWFKDIAVIEKHIRAAVDAEQERLLAHLRAFYDDMEEMAGILSPSTEAREAKLAGFRQAIIELEIAAAIREER